MPKFTTYTSSKPVHQTDPKDGTQPPMGSVAVFEWETFSKLSDFSDESLNKVFNQISRDIIERPYHYDSHKLFKDNGVRIDQKNTMNLHVYAGNLSPPDKIPEVAVYKQNHGTGHAIRQMFYTNTLINKIAQEGTPDGQEIAKKVINNPEITSILKLAAYCKRIGRTLDYEHDNHPIGQPTIYSKRSSEMFSKIAEELGYNQDLINVIAESMLEPHPKNSPQLTGKTIAGIDTSDLKHFSENILMAAHMADLTRLFTVKTQYIKTALNDYFKPEQLPAVSRELVEMACKANAMTGNPVVQQESGINHQETSVDGKKLVAVVQDIGGAIQSLSQLSNLKLSRPEGSIENTYAHKAFSLSKGRTHLFSASVPSGTTENFKERYKSSQGDHLKTKILDDLRDKIENTTSKGELEDFTRNLMKSPEYEILKKGQALFTRVTGIKTSSVAALEDMIKQKEKSLEDDTPTFKA